MAESSMFWTTDGTGDGPDAGYTAANWLALLQMLFAYDLEKQGPFKRYLNELEVTNPSGRNIKVDTGGAMVYGIPYWNGAAETKTLTHPTVGTTGWRVVLRADWAAQTVRIALLEAADGTATPTAVTQDPGTTYEISLAYGTITTGDVIAVTDDRAFLNSNIEIVAAMLAAGTFTADTAGRAAFAAGFVSNDLIRDSAALSILGRAANSAGDVADIAAASNNTVLKRASNALAFAQVATDDIADEAVTAAKIANRTASFFVPVTRGWEQTEAVANAMRGYAAAGWQCGDGIVAKVIGEFYVPDDYVSDLTIQAVVQCGGATGAHYSNLTVYHATDGEAYNAASAQAGIQQVTSTTTLEYILSVASSAAKTDLVTCVFERAANNALDTATATTVYVKGFIVSYTRDH